MLDSVKAFMKSSNVKRGRTQKELTTAGDAILYACIFTSDVNKVTIQEHLGVSMVTFSKAVRKEDDVRYNHTTS